MKNLELDVRYYHQPRKARVTESDFQHKPLHWSLPVKGVALVLVDVWSDLYVTSHLQRARGITIERIIPVLEAFRRVGAAVVHAPSPDCARKYPQWIQYAGDDTVEGIFHRLFEFRTPAEAAHSRASLMRDAAFWKMLQNLSERFGSAPGDRRIRFSFRIYSTPAGSGKTLSAGSGRAVSTGPGRTAPVTAGTGRFCSYGVENGLAGADVRAICPDRNGVALYDGQTFTVFAEEDGLAGDCALFSLEDRAGHVWFATYGGVSCYDESGWITFTKNDGLLSDRVQSLMQDRQGHLLLIRI